MNKKYQAYRKAQIPKSKTNQLWPLFGAGLENLGVNDKPIHVPFPEVNPDELLVRHDACGLCFSDIKVIRSGEDHPRIYRIMKEDPVVLGHEVSMTVVSVGENLKKQYQPGDRFILQADIHIDGVGYAYGYEIQGGLSQYNIIDQRILNGDHGNYLIPIHPDTGFAESALVEPWACVIAAYYLQYRTQLKNCGTAWFVGPDNGSFSLSTGMDQSSHPAKIKLTKMDGEFGNWLRKRATRLGIPVIEVEKIEPMAEEALPADQADDIILLSPTINLIETLSAYLAYQGILAFSTQERFERRANLDIGRIHYNRWLFSGGTDSDIAAIYNRKPIRSEIKKGGSVYFVGAGGPMGRMHVQHAIEIRDHPSLIVCSDISDERLEDLNRTFAPEAQKKGIELLFVNPIHNESYEEAMAGYKETGFDDTIALVPIASAITEAVQWLANDGVMNIFAGVARGTTAKVNLNDIVFRDVRIIGHSGSTVEDMLTMLQKVESGELDTNRSVAAIGSLSAAKDGLQALIDAKYPGKVLIYPNIRDLPLTAVADLNINLPEVAAKIKNGRTWTKEAEIELLNQMLVD